MTYDLPVGDPELLARVRSLHLAARRLVSGLHTGSHLAVRRGYEAEFLGYQPYVAPHPLKDIDWHAFTAASPVMAKVWPETQYSRLHLSVTSSRRT